MWAVAGTVAGDADIDWSIYDAFQLEFEIGILTIVFEVFSTLEADAIYVVANAFARCFVFNDDEVPGLHEAHGASFIGRV